MSHMITSMRELKLAQYRLQEMMRLPKGEREGFEALASDIDAYERKRFPYGTPEFEEWLRHLEEHPEEADRISKEIEEAEEYVRGIISDK